MTDGAHDELKKLAIAVMALIAAANLKSRKAVAALILQIHEEIGASYAAIAAQSVDDAKSLAAIEAAFTVKALNDAAQAQLVRVPTLTVNPAIGGMPLAEWWRAQAKDTASKMGSLVRFAAMADETGEQAAARVSAATSPIGQAMRHAESLTNTIVQRISLDTRHAVAKANSSVIQEIQVFVTLDSHICAQCLAYDGATYTVDGEPTGNTSLSFNGGPPFHMNCRCITVPVFKNLPNVPRTDGAPGARLSATQWLDGKSEDEQDEILGKGRASLYREGKITLTDLVTRTGKQLSLADLREKYNIPQ